MGTASAEDTEMEEKYSTEWWRWQLYRQIADYLHQPNSSAQASLNALLQAYRQQQQGQQPLPQRDEHEWVMDWQ